MIFFTWVSFKLTNICQYFCRLKACFVSVSMASQYEIKHLSISITIFLFTFIFINPVAADSSPIYKAEDDIVLDCGFSGGSFVPGDSRDWTGDVDSEFFPSQFQLNNESVPSRGDTESSSVVEAPYVTARLSRSEFTYLFPVSPGPKYLRLYFYAASYPDFDHFKAVFSVKNGPYTLLRDFNASFIASASSSDKIFREFCVYIDGNDRKLNITFTPTNQDTYAFISGIEIVSMPVNLYYSPVFPPPNDRGGRGLKLVGQNNRFFPIENDTTLEMVYRINIGGNLISLAEDTGMFRTWSEERYLYHIEEDAQHFNTTIILNFSKIPAFTAPEDVYRNARTMGPNATLNKSYNVTWKYPVDPGFLYMLRLHFCEFEGHINAAGDRVFLIYVHDLVAEESADVIRWTGGKGIPYYRDYVVNVSSSDNEKKVNLSVKLQPKYDDLKMVAWSNVILNGIEIFKLNDSNGNLAGQDSYLSPTSDTKDYSNGILGVIVTSATVGGFVFCMVGLLVLAFFIFQKKDRISRGVSRRAPLHVPTSKSNKIRNSSLSSDPCRYFSLSEIKIATRNFDDSFIIGVGGFGYVYKGYVDDGATQVAIKRLKPDSKQGANEFKTEIEMLSQLRHLHLVSLIGYCDDGNEMILIYDYMSRGTLRSHLYNNDGPSLPWKQRLQICIGAARGLQYLHSGTKCMIIHRDVKTTNILLDEKWVVKVSDFGLSKVRSMDISKTHVSTEVKGSFGYLDPEYYRRQRLTEKSDVYAFGVVLCEILCGRPAVINSEDMKQNNLADWVRWCESQNTTAHIVDKNIEHEITPECLRKFIEIAVSCIQDEGNQRPSMEDVVWGLKIVLQLQKSCEGVVNNLGHGDGEMNNDEECLLEMDDILDQNNGESNFAQNKGCSRYFFTEIMDLNNGR